MSYIEADIPPKADFAKSTDKQIFHGKIYIDQNLILPLNVITDERGQIICVIYIEDSTLTTSCRNIH